MLPFIKKYLSALWVAVTWTLLIAIAMCLPGSYIPNEGGFSIPNFDKLVHMALFGGFVFLWCLYLSARELSFRKLLIGFFCFFAIGNGLGIATEFIQKYWIPGRDFDLADIIADMAGAGIGYGVANLWLLPGKKGTGGRVDAEDGR